MYFLYRHIRADKNEPFYIGIGKKNDSGVSFKDKYKRAFIKSQRNQIWRRIINKTGYEVEIILEDENKIFIEKKEKEFIKIYGRKDLNTGTLSNITDGGEGINNPSEAARKRMSNAMIGNKRGVGNKQSEYSKMLISERFKGNTFWKGRKHKEESKEKISIARKNKPLPIYHRKSLIGTKPQSKKVFCENNGVSYNSICDCVRVLFNCDISSYDSKFLNYKNNISKVCNKKKKYYKGYILKFV